MARPKKVKKKRKPSPYAVFVKAHYAAAKSKFKTPQERIRHIAKLWRESKKLKKREDEKKVIEKTADTA